MLPYVLNPMLVGLGRPCALARTVPPRSVGKPRNSFHARRFIERGGIATNVGQIGGRADNR